MSPPLELDDKQRVAFTKFATEHADPPYDDLQDMYNVCFAAATPFFDEGLTTESFNTAFVTLLEFYADDDTLPETLNEGVRQTRETIPATWQKQLRLQFKHQSAATECSDRNLPESDPIGMQVDHGVGGEKTAAPKPTDPPRVEGSAAGQAAVHKVAAVNADNANASTCELPDSIAQSAADNAKAARDKLIDSTINSTSLTAVQKIHQIKDLNTMYDARQPTVSSFKSNSRSCPLEPFLGRASDHGQVASTWLYGLELYFQAEPTPNPVAKAVTYLHGDARY